MKTAGKNVKTQLADFVMYRVDGHVYVTCKFDVWNGAYGRLFAPLRDQLWRVHSAMSVLT